MFEECRDGNRTQLLPSWSQSLKSHIDIYQIEEHFDGRGTSFRVNTKEEHPMEPRRSRKAAWRKWHLT